MYPSMVADDEIVLVTLDIVHYLAGRHQPPVPAILKAPGMKPTDTCREPRRMRSKPLPNQGRGNAGSEDAAGI
jgi:hypothetical protein